MAKADLDIWIRARFSVSQGAKDRHEDAVLLREALAKGFEGQRVPLIAGQGIFWPDNDGVERWVVSRPPGLTARGRESSIRPLYAPACLLGVERRALLVG